MKKQSEQSSKFRVSAYFKFALFLVIVLLSIQIFNCWQRKAPENIWLAAQQRVRLYTGETGTETYIQKGDSVRILGQVTTYAIGTMSFWVETQDGRRGYAPQEAFDNQFIIYSTYPKDSLLAIQPGDTVTVTSRSDDDSYAHIYVTTRDGRKGELRHDQALSVTGSGLKNYCIGDRVGHFMSKEKFERMYIGKPLTETDRLYQQAQFVYRDKEGMKASYPNFLFDKSDGKFYKATVLYKDGIAVSYTTELYSSKHDWLLRYLPLADKVLDIDLFSTLISGNQYQRESFSHHGSGILSTVWKIILFIFFMLFWGYWLFFTGHFITFCLLALLECHWLFRPLGNRLVYWLFVLIDLPFIYAWLVLGLCYYFQWWYLIPGLYFFTRMTWRMVKEYAEVRCPGCRRLATVLPDRQELIKRYNEWRQRSKTTVTGESEKKWKTFRRTTTTYRDGHQTYQDDDFKYYTETTTNTRTDIYNVLYRVTKYKQYYKCCKCGFERCEEKESLKELNSKHQGSYHDTSVSTRVMDQYGQESFE